MTPSASVSRNTWPWARTRRAAGALTAVAVVLFLPATAAVAGQGGIPSPDPSHEFAPDPAPSGGQPATAGGTAGPAPQPSHRAPPAASTPPARDSQPVAPATAAPSGAAVRSAPARQRVRRHHRRAAKHSPAQLPRPTAHHTHALARPFVATLRLAFAPAGTSIETAGGPGDALGLAALALLLLVVAGLLVVRASAQLLQRERPT
jgi:hypothetical protein